MVYMPEGSGTRNNNSQNLVLRTSPERSYRARLRASFFTKHGCAVLALTGFVDFAKASADI